MQFKDKLKEIRKLNKWSQQEFADKLEERRSTYAEWENGTVPSFDIVVKISAVSGVSILEFAATIDENLANNNPTTGYQPTKAPITVEFLLGKLEGKDELIAEKEARRKDVADEKNRYYNLIEKYLVEIHSNSKEIADDISALTDEIQAEHRAMMDSIDVAAGQPIGTTSAAADNVELASQKEHVGKGKSSRAKVGKLNK